MVIFNLGHKKELDLEDFMDIVRETRRSEKTGPKGKLKFWTRHKRERRKRWELK